jgi:hypothetical protein
MLMILFRHSQWTLVVYGDIFFCKIWFSASFCPGRYLHSQRGNNPASHHFIPPTTSRPDSRNGVTPDYGTNYVPNAGPTHLAPQSLDHFKRGYAERANQRDKEHYSRRHGPTGRERRNAGGGPPQQSRPMIVEGLDINRAIDRLTPLVNSRQALFKELDMIAQENPTIIGSGKTMTLLISAVARRKEIGVGNAIWEVRNALSSRMDI